MSIYTTHIEEPDTGKYLLVYGSHDQPTLRDYFAAKAMCCLIANEEYDDAVERMVIISYQYADAMLAARLKP